MSPSSSIADCKVLHSMFMVDSRPRKYYLGESNWSTLALMKIYCENYISTTINIHFIMLYITPIYYTIAYTNLGLQSTFYES